jgi:hypothetical protein
VQSCTCTTHAKPHGMPGATRKQSSQGPATAIITGMHCVIDPLLNIHCSAACSVLLSIVNFLKATPMHQHSHHRPARVKPPPLQPNLAPHQEAILVFTSRGVQPNRWMPNGDDQNIMQHGMPPCPKRPGGLAGNCNTQPWLTGPAYPATAVPAAAQGDSCSAIMHLIPHPKMPQRANLPTRLRTQLSSICAYSSTQTSTAAAERQRSP